MNPTNRGALSAAFLAVSACAAVAAVPVSAPPSPVMTPASAPAAGRHEAILRVGAFGRYAVTVTSAQGAALQLVDRMAGPGPLAGRVGEQDGRVDAFLDRGETKVVVLGHERASGDARLEVHAFTELSVPKPPLLVEGKPVSVSLGDLQQVSWWLQVGERRQVFLEAAGRHLAELKLWRDGTWAIDAAASCEVVTPVEGKPLNACRLWPTLEPGLYLVSAYGGAGVPWAAGGDVRPLYLRFGVPLLPEAGRRAFKVSPFGIDRFLLPGTATFVRIELPEARPAVLAVSSFDEEAPFGRGGEGSVEGRVEKTSMPPAAELRVEHSDGKRSITVSGEAGQPYVLQHFFEADRYQFEGTQEYYVASIHSGTPLDNADATGLVVRSCPNLSAERTPFLDQVLELSGSDGWARRFNLLDRVVLLVHLNASERLKVVAGGDASARFRFEPFFLSLPPGYAAPAFKRAGESWDLDSGFYVLTIEPEKKGILEVAIRATGVLDRARDALGLVAGVAAEPARPAVRFPAVKLDRDCGYWLILGSLPGVTSGVVLRPLPLDVAAAPLPLALRPAEEVELRITAAEAGTLSADAEDGAPFEVTVDGGAPTAAPSAAAGSHTVKVRNPGSTTRWASLRLHPARLAADAPLPELPDAALMALPAFPELTTGKPAFLDLAREESATFTVRAERAALYRLETSGLLATSGAVRTRVITSLDRQGSNGVGRNFLIQQYLREGEYQLTVRPEGASTGHVGVHLSEAAIDDGGTIAPGVPARATLAPGHGIAYRFTIAERATYDLRSFGLQREVRCRIEDGEGWPLEAPGGVARFHRELEPGRYRLVLLPDAVEARRVTLLERVTAAPQLLGHGPHPLVLDSAVEHVWLEPEAGGERTPDRWVFDLPAPAEVRIELSGEMQGVVRPAEGGEILATVPPGRSWSGPLPAGRLVLEAVCSRRNNRAAYTVAVRPEPLLAGMSRHLDGPAEIAVAVGRTGLAELYSFGGSDVRADLIDSEGRTVASGDDRPDDWGFLLAARLTPGRYTLRVAAVGKSDGACTVTMRMPDEVEEPVLAAPGRRELATGEAIRVVPLALDGRAAWLEVTARADETVGLTLEVDGGAGWQAAGTSIARAARLEVPLPQGPAARARLRVWSADQRGLPVELVTATTAPRGVSEDALARGAALEGGALAVRLDRPGTFRVAGLCWTVRAGAACSEAADGDLVVAPGRELWVWGERGAVAKATRVRLGGAELAIATPAGGRATIDLDAVRAELTVVSARAIAGQPGTRLVTNAGARGPWAVTRGGAVTAALGTTAGVEVWNADGDATPLQVRLTRITADLAAATPAGWGPLSGEVSGRALVWTLPAGSKRVRLSLDAGAIGVLIAGGAVESVHGGGAAACDETVVTSADRLVLLAPGTAPHPFAVALTAERGAAPAVTSAQRFEAVSATSGTLRVRVVRPEDAGQPWMLRVRGAREAMLVGDDGRVARGLDLPAGDGGTLVLSHTAGPVIAWLEGAREAASPLWPDAVPPAADVTAPAVVALGGEVQAFRVRVGGPSVVQVRGEAPMVTRVVRDGDAPEVEVHPERVRLDVAAAATLEIAVRPVAGRPLSGSLTITAVAARTAGEGLGPAVLLPPDGARAFTFSVPSERDIGVGVRSDGARVEVSLLDAAGHRLGRGVVLMRRLHAGSYLLLLTNPEDAAPAVARPALAGLELPGDGPPEDVVRRYLKPDAGGEAEGSQPDATQWRRPQPPAPDESTDEGGGDEPSDETQESR